MNPAGSNVLPPTRRQPVERLPAYRATHAVGDLADDVFTVHTLADPQHRQRFGRAGLHLGEQGAYARAVLRHLPYGVVQREAADQEGDLVDIEIAGGLFCVGEVSFQSVGHWRFPVCVCVCV